MRERNLAGRQDISEDPGTLKSEADELQNDHTQQRVSEDLSLLSEMIWNHFLPNLSVTNLACRLRKSYSESEYQGARPNETRVPPTKLL